jgi:hypothetical protein
VACVFVGGVWSTVSVSGVAVRRGGSARQGESLGTEEERGEERTNENTKGHTGAQEGRAEAHGEHCDRTTVPHASSACEPRRDCLSLCVCLTLRE